MSETHTPVPWRRGEWHSGGLIDIKAADAIVAQVRLRSLSTVEAIQETLANANLIVTAVNHHADAKSLLHAAHSYFASHSDGQNEAMELFRRIGALLKSMEEQGG